MTPLVQRLGRLLAILAIFTAFGGHWLVLQSVAWTRMVIDSARTAPLAEAVAETFDGRHPCALCKKLEQGKSREKKQDVQVFVGKLNLFFEPSVIRLTPARESWEQTAPNRFAEARLQAPPVPPPRLTVS